MLKRRDWFFVLLPIPVIWYLDRLTKVWASTMDGTQPWGPFQLTLHHNPGVMLGLFSDLPPVLRVVTLTTACAFLICTYALIQYLLPIRSLTLRVGLSILLAGIVGNVSDRIVWGHVVDFIHIEINNWSSPVFNLADAFQWVGYAMIFYVFFRHGNILWPEKEMRKIYWVNRKFQLKYCILLLSLGAGIGLISMAFSYTYLQVTLLELTGNNPQILRRFLLPFAITFSLIVAGCSVALFVVGKIISHKIAGPVYAYQKYVGVILQSRVSKDPIRDFQLRSQDDFQELEALARSLRETLGVPVASELSAATTENENTPTPQQ